MLIWEGGTARGKYEMVGPVLASLQTQTLTLDSEPGGGGHEAVLQLWAAGGDPALPQPLVYSAVHILDGEAAVPCNNTDYLTNYSLFVENWTKMHNWLLAPFTRL